MNNNKPADNNHHHRIKPHHPPMLQELEEEQLNAVRGGDQQQQGPLSVAIDAGSVYFQLYNSGQYDDFLCSQQIGAEGYIDRMEIYGMETNRVETNTQLTGKNACKAAEIPSYPVV